MSQTPSVHLQGFENAAHEYDAKINATTKKLLSLRNISPVRSFIFHQLQQVKNCHFFSPIKFQRQEMLLLEKVTAENGTTGIPRDYSAQNSLPDPDAGECQTCTASNL